MRSANRDTVLTAGHCVNDGPGAFHTNWMFVPGYRDGARPYGTWTARDLLTTSGLDALYPRYGFARRAVRRFMRPA